MIRAALLGCALLAACAPSPGGRTADALARVEASGAALEPDETAELARLRALPVRGRDGGDATRALATWDWRSALSGRGPPAPFWSEGGAAYAAALAGRDDALLSPADRHAAALEALEAARAARALAPLVETRARADLAEVAAAPPPPAGRKAPPSPAAARAEARGALLAAMAASVSADATAIGQDAQAMGVYAGPARRDMTALAAEASRIAAELEGRAAAIGRALPQS